ncbi:hypothetical protein KIW84_031146 [Lathyrus oleraceus]|uniref:RNA helicase n=1 Tax=Pisum sativum TaxID=3888 RepID=A0A9D5AZX8_PEA|nr:hypothetical protein KIW84_031144 [Pisum sativum]KAI5425228.1 hypothetical protein KIW84_031146 [Pisum sativum]
MVDYNRDTVPNKDITLGGERVNIPFPCDCVNGDFLAHNFSYDVQNDDTYASVVGSNYANLTNVQWLRNFNTYPPNSIHDTGTLNDKYLQKVHFSKHGIPLPEFMQIDDLEGAVLVFLPGVFEINHLHDKLAASYRFGGPSSDWLTPLHSSVASTEQKKENRYNPQKKLSSMVEDWISQANARQRQGRAGRVRPGICFRWYTRYRFEKLMRPYQVPEMLRMPFL